MAATQLWFARPGVAMTQANPDLLDKTITIFLEEKNNLPIEGESLFRRDNADAPTFELTTWSKNLDVPVKATDTDPMPYQDFVPGYKKEFTVAQYMSALRITKTMLDDDRSGKVMQMMGGLLDSGRRMIELMLANVLNTSTTTAGADGSYVFANDHYQTAGGATWSNIETGAAFSSTAVNAMRVSMATRKDNRGFVSPLILKKLVVPPALEEKARQYSSTDRVYDSSLWATNPWKGTEVMVYHYLTNTTAFYGVAEGSTEDSGLHYIVREQPSLNDLGYPSPEYPRIAKGWYIAMRVAAGASVVRGMHRNAGA